jgi:hypothetical protein
MLMICGPTLRTNREGWGTRRTFSRIMRWSSVREKSISPKKDVNTECTEGRRTQRKIKRRGIGGILRLRVPTGNRKRTDFPERISGRCAQNDNAPLATEGVKHSEKDSRLEAGRTSRTAKSGCATRTLYIFSSSRRRLVWARLTGTSDWRLSAILSM